MFEKVAWFAVAYACVSITVTVLMLVFANKAFSLGGPLGMVRSIFLLLLAAVGLISWTAKALFSEGPTPPPSQEIKRTVRKASGWMNDLKSEWDNAKDDHHRHPRKK